MSDILLIQFDLSLYLFDFIVPRIALADGHACCRERSFGQCSQKYLVAASRCPGMGGKVDKLYVLYTDIGRITWRGFWGLVVWGFVAIAHQM